MAADCDLDANWLIDPKHLFVGPRIGKAHAKVYEGKLFLFLNQGGLKESDVDSFVDDVLVNDKPWASVVQEALTGSHVFVCAHGSRDNRCGVCGPVRIDKFKEEAELRGLTNQVFVTACSHIGGHKYAGNLIIYSPGSDGSITLQRWRKRSRSSELDITALPWGKWEYLLMKLKKLMT